MTLKIFKTRIKEVNKAMPFNGQTEKDLYSHIMKSQNDPIILFAHSINKGRKIILPNGKSLPVSEVHEKCIIYTKSCLVLTCDGDDFLIDGKVSALDALYIWSESMKKINPNMNTDDLRKIMQIYREKAKTKNEKRKTKNEKRKTKNEKRKTKNEKPYIHIFHFSLKCFCFVRTFVKIQKGKIE